MFALPLLLALIPLDCIRDEQMDILGVNHVYDANCNLCGDYMNFWRMVDGGRYDGQIICEAWRQYRETGRPHRDGRGWYRLWWFDRGILRNVRSRVICETWTQYDREVWDRKVFPPELRWGLRR